MSENSRFKLGQKVRQKYIKREYTKGYGHSLLNGKVGVVVDVLTYKKWRAVGVNFGEIVPYVTNTCHGLLPESTGRYILEAELDNLFDFVSDKEYENLYE